MTFCQVDAVIDKIIEEARTGEIGDGKIFGKITLFVQLDIPYFCSGLR